VPDTGPVAVGAVHGAGVRVAVDTPTVCRPRLDPGTSRAGHSCALGRATVTGVCGRYATTRSAADLAALFEAEDGTHGALAPDYNIAPTDPVPVVRVSRSAGGRIVDVAAWGLVPAYATDTRGAARMINARAETVATSGAFATSFARRRCLVPADGWYEWAGRTKGQKQAFYMTAPDGAVLAFAGVWTVWGQGPDRLLTCAVVTTAAVGDLVAVHDRMPLLLPPDRWAGWLTGQADPAALLAAPDPAFVDRLEIRPVGPEVGNVHNDGPSLIARAATPTPLTASEERADLTLF
jgi:putative SOS response-associated peptidase YedK